MGTSNRRPGLTAMTLDQDFLDEMASNLEFVLEMAVDIETPSGDIIRASDRNKYVGTTFYRALCTFPLIKRTIGEWLSPTIEFSTLEIPLSNVDGRYNNYLPGGADFDGWIGREVTIRLGLREAAGTYFNIYRGTVTEIGGLSRDRTKIAIRTRDSFDKYNVNFPKYALTAAGFPDIEDGLVNTILPVIYGDWTVAPLQETPDPTPGNPPLLTASVPAFAINGKHADVIAGTANIRFLVSENVNESFDVNNVWVRRGDLMVNVPSGNVTGLIDNRDFQVVQGFTYDAEPYIYQPGDDFFVRVKGRSITPYSDNIVEQARNILINYGGALVGDFTVAWDNYRSKNAPAVSAIVNIKSRVWTQDPESAVTYALSMLEQVRLEMFVDRDLKLNLRSLHLEDFDATPPFTVKQWDLQAESLGPKLDDKNIWNRARGEFAYDPALKAQSRQTATFRNQGAIDQANKEISKKVIFPNLYVESDVAYQLQEMLRLASGYPEFVDMVLSPRATLLDVGDFVALDIRMGSVVYEGVPAMIREIGYDPKGGIPVRVWSFQMTPFPGWEPGYSGTVGGSTVGIITQE